MHPIVIAQKVANYPGILMPDRPIAFNRDFVKLGIGVKGALFLSQAIYWSKRTKDHTGWFYKTVEEWEEETGLTAEEQRTIKKDLMGQDLIEIEKRGIPAKNYFKVDLDNVAASLISIIPITSAVDSPVLDAGKSQDSLYTENTQESTHISEAPLRVVQETPDGEEKSKPAPKYPHSKEVFALWGSFPKNWLANTTQRVAAENLYEERGIQAVKDALEWYETVKHLPYCPQMTSPYDLDSKWDKLDAFSEKKHD